MEDGVRTRLILAGLSELEEYGIRDFSLRRVAVTAQVSCAAPYRHFKDKDEFILEIVRYIGSSWALLCEQIEQSFTNDLHRLVIELCMANLRFWLANSHFRTVLMLSPNETELSAELMKIDTHLLKTLESYALARGIEDVWKLKFSVRSLIYGTVLLVGTGEMKNDETTQRLVKESLEVLLKP